MIYTVSTELDEEEVDILREAISAFVANSVYAATSAGAAFQLSDSVVKLTYKLIDLQDAIKDMKGGARDE
jgi:hypothetical protein